jgi:hypothetical protein
MKDLAAWGAGGNKPAWGGAECKIEGGRTCGVSACTVNVGSEKNMVTTASDNAAATGQNHRGLAGLGLCDFWRSIIWVFY